MTGSRSLAGDEDLSPHLGAGRTPLLSAAGKRLQPHLGAGRVPLLRAGRGGGGGLRSGRVVLQHVVEGDPVLRLLHQQLVDQSLGSSLHTAWNFHVRIEDLQDRMSILNLERGTPYEHFVEECSTRPYVHLLGVGALLYPLWCHVVDTSAHRLLSYGRVGALHHAPKVSYHQCLAIFLQEKKIVRLDVPVDNLLSMEILQPANQLLQVICSRSLIASSPGLFLDELRHIPSKGIVQDHEDPCEIVEIPVAFEYIFVIEG